MSSNQVEDFMKYLQWLKNKKIGTPNKKTK